MARRTANCFKHNDNKYQRKKILDKLQDNQWIISENEVYFCRQYVTKWDDDDDEPYLIIRMERDWLYRIKNMASGFQVVEHFVCLEMRKVCFQLTQKECKFKIR